MKLTHFFLRLFGVLLGCLLLLPGTVLAQNVLDDLPSAGTQTAIDFLNRFNLEHSLATAISDDDEGVIEVNGGSFESIGGVFDDDPDTGQLSNIGWKVVDDTDYIDFDIRTLCTGLITFQVRGISDDLFEERGFSGLFSLYDDEETGRKISEDEFRGACYDSGAVIGGSEEEIFVPDGAGSCDDLGTVTGRGAPVRVEPRSNGSLCVFDSSGSLQGDVIAYHSVGKTGDYRGAEQSDGDPYGAGVNPGGSSQQLSWDPNILYEVEVRWDPRKDPDGVAKLQVTRKTVGNDPAFQDDGQVDTIVVDNEFGQWRPARGVFRLGNTATLSADGTRVGETAAPGLIFTNVDVEGFECDASYEGCPQYHNSICSDPDVFEDPPVVSFVDPDNPPNVFDVDTCAQVGPLGGCGGFGLGVQIAFEFLLDPFVAASKEAGIIPEVTVQLAGTAERGQPASFVAVNQGLTGSVYTSWFVDDVFQGGLMAGGELITETFDENFSIDQFPGRACRPVTRVPREGSDVDGDGMDDRWEIEHGLDPGDPTDAFDNPDGDGFAASLADGRDTPFNSSGQALIPAPAIVYQLPSGEQGRYVLGSGDLPNVAEYVLGTDPNNPDTDADGIDDARDAAGIGGGSFEFVPTKVSGQKFAVRAISTGQNFQYFSSVETGDAEVVVDPGQPLELGFGVNSQFVESGDEVEVAVSVSGARTDTENLNVEWAVEEPVRGDDGVVTGVRRVDLCEGADVCGVGKNVLKYSLDSFVAGENVVFIARVTERSTGRRVEDKYVVRVGGGLQLQVGSCAPDDTSCIDCDFDDPVPAADENVLVRAGEVVSGEAVSYDWWLDGGLVRDDRADANQLCFPVTRPETSEYEVDVVATNERGVEFGSPGVVVEVGVPIVEVLLNPEEPVRGQSVEIFAIPEDFEDDANNSYVYEWRVNGVSVDGGQVLDYVAEGDALDIEVVARAQRERGGTITGAGRVRVETVSDIGQDVGEFGASVGRVMSGAWIRIREFFL